VNFSSEGLFGVLVELDSLVLLLDVRVYRVFDEAHLNGGALPSASQKYAHREGKVLWLAFCVQLEDRLECLQIDRHFLLALRELWPELREFFEDLLPLEV
jgi:hypothetical protein